MNKVRPVSHRPRVARRGDGFTLIEALIAMVVLAAATTGVLLIFANATADSADPQVRAQARAVAEAYMDEILLQPVADPDGSDGETDRSDFDDVDDYDGIDESPTDMFGNSIAGLNGYTVQVDVSGANPAQIDVRVTHSAGVVDYSLYGERHQY